jgi:toxin-antitoxin system PIN domain toxin
LIALDTNILVHAARPEMKFHAQAVRLISGLAEQSNPWAIPWPCVYEFLRVVTNPRVFSPPSDLSEALGSLERLRESPSLVILGQSPGHLRTMLRTIRDSDATGNLVHDAHIAAICIEHGVSELYTMDRDFSRFRGLKATRPF